MRLESVEDGHASGNAVLDLLGNEAAVVVEHRIAEFDPAVDRPGMHDVSPLARKLTEALIGDAIEIVILAIAREEGRGHALFLNPEKINCVRTKFADRLIVVRKARDVRRGGFRNETPRSEEGNFHAEFSQNSARGSCDPTMANITGDEDTLSLHLWKFFTKGKGVE